MTRFSVELLPQAEAEIREAFLWYLARSPLAATEFREEALHAIDGLGETADTWPEDESGVRYYALRHFPYTVFYEFSEACATVLAVAHQRRKPDYWRDRQIQPCYLFQNPIDTGNDGASPRSFQEQEPFRFARLGRPILSWL